MPHEMAYDRAPRAHPKNVENVDERPLQGEEVDLI